MSLHPIDRIVGLTMDVGRFMKQCIMDAPEPNDEKGPSMLQLHALISIREHESMTMKDFARCMRTSGATATASVDRLVRLGWVSRKKDKSNRKIVKISLTPSGAKVVQRKMDARRAFMASVLSQLPAKDQQEFVRILEDLLSIMQRQSGR